MVANEFQLYITNIFQNAVGDSPGIPAERNMMGRNAEFDTLAGGELNAQFRQAIRLVGRNIMDPNMDPAASRGITVTLSFKPRGDGTVGLGFKVVPKLAAAGQGGDDTVNWSGRPYRPGRNAGAGRNQPAGGCGSGRGKIV